MLKDGLMARLCGLKGRVKDLKAVDVRTGCKTHVVKFIFLSGQF